MNKNLKNDYVFLIGGYDLEMQEIKNILAEHNCQYIDKKLNWGAKLSSYQEYFDNKEFNEKTFVGIELIKDCDVPGKYIEIDHHNENKSLPSSIQQVANLLDIELDRRQVLISANDSGYIKGLIEQNASDKEIVEIRSEDRKAQGITEEDEVKATESVKNNSKFTDSLLVIESLTNRFSAVCDAVFVSAENYEKYKKIIIYDENEVDYYFYNKDGNIISRLEELVKKEVTPENGYSFSGGSEESGFFGVGFNTPSIEKAREIVEKIKETL